MIPSPVLIGNQCEKNRKSMEKFDIAIIGGGASGLAAAALVSKSGKRVLVAERGARAGQKLLMTGNGRCNLSHSPLELGAYHGDAELARAVLAKWEGAERFFASLGLVCVTDGDGRVYPHSNAAASVLDALRLAAFPNAAFMPGTTCSDITPIDGGFLINGGIFAKKLIWAAGGGETSNFGPLGKIGHTIITPFPSLCPIITDKALTRPLKGLRVRAVCRAEAGGKTLKSERGEVQFNDGSLSGICVMNLSRLVRDYGNRLTVSLDIAPDFTPGELREIINKRAGCAPEDRFTGLFRKRIGAALAQRRGDAVGLIKDWRFPVTGTAPLGKAQVTAGGVPAAELNGDLSSKLHPNLFIIGEAVNVDGDCGGYNLAWAWASAAEAARAATRRQDLP